MDTVDARGLSCPQPVLVALEKMRAMGSGRMEILVDTDTARENVIRAAAGQGWRAAETQTEGMEYRITLEKN